MKRLLNVFIVLGALVVLGGCASEMFYVDTGKTDKPVVGSGFDDEEYVWEDWLYSTNKVNLILKSGTK